MTTASSPKADELREQAATWFARMRGPDAEALKPEFEQWLASAADRRAAYNRIAARFSEAKLLRASQIAYPATSATLVATTPVRMRRWALALAALLSLSCALITAYPHLTSRTSSPIDAPQSAQQVATFTTLHGQIRNVRLADGSLVSLDTDSVLTVHFTLDRRALRLERGRARFNVAHQPRPFIVTAGGGTITALGTLFDVAVDAQRRVQVMLMRGAVDVVAAADTSAHAATRRLRPGDAIGFAATSPNLARMTPAAIQPSWPTGLVDFDEAPIGDVVTEANRYAQTPIILADPISQALRVSGRFGVRDPEALAANLAHLFDLMIDRSRTDAIVLRRQPPA